MSDAVNQDQNRAAVVVPLDGSELAERALPLARAFMPANGELVLVEVLPGPTALTELATAELLTPVELDADQNAEARGQMEAVAQRLRDEGVAARALVLEGEPVHEITRVASELQAELIVMATHGRGALRRLAHGSVADGVSRRAATPVLLVRVRNANDHELADAQVRRLVVPHDGSETAAQAVPVATRYAKILNVPVLLVRAVNPSGDLQMAFAPAGGPDTISSAVYEEVLEDEENAANSSLDAVKAEMANQGVTVTSEVMIGTAVAVIGEMHAPGDVVVMSSHGRSGIGRWLLGSVAETLVREGTAPVIVVPAADRVAAHEAHG